MKSKALLSSVNNMIERDLREEHFRNSIEPMLNIREGEEPLLKFYKRYYVLTGKTDYKNAFCEARAINVFKNYSRELEQLNYMPVVERLELLERIQNFVDTNDRKTPYCKVEELAKKEFGSVGLFRVGGMINLVKQVEVSTVYDLRDNELDELIELASVVAKEARENVDRVVFEID